MHGWLGARHTWSSTNVHDQTSILASEHGMPLSDSVRQGLFAEPSSNRPSTAAPKVVQAIQAGHAPDLLWP